MNRILTIYGKKGIALFEFSGAMTISDGREAFVDYVNQAEFNPDHIMITDARAVTSIEATFSKMLLAVFGLHHPLKLFTHGSKSIILVQDPTQFGYARMLEQVLDYISPIRVQIAISEEEALSMAGRVERSFAELRA